MFDNYAQLEAEVGRRLDRDFDSPSFRAWKREAESWMANGTERLKIEIPKLRTLSMEIESTLTATNGRYDMPDRLLEIKQLEGSLYGEKLLLDYLEPNQFTNVVSQYRPKNLDELAVYTVKSGQVVAGPEVSGPLSLSWYQEIPELTSANWDGHIVIAADPAVYLYGILANAYHRYRNHSEEMSELDAMAGVVKRLNAKAERQRSGDLPLKITVGGVI